MTDTEKLELLRVAVVLAMADGELSRSEKGVIEGLAARVGVGSVSLQAMIETAQANDSIADNILMGSKERATTALELFVAQARIDGEITDDERSILVRIATSLDISDAEFIAIYETGLARADKLRKSRQSPS